MAVRWAISSGNFSSTATWNDGATLGIPTTGDDVWSNGFTVAMDINATVNSLNNTIRLRNVVTATMTSNNTPSPNVVSSSAGAEPWRAFDRSFATALASSWSTGANTVPAFIIYDFGLGNTRIVDGYTIYASSDSASNPRAWTLDGSNDNTNWTQLNIQSLGAAIPSSSSFTVASINNTQSYRYYRIRVTQTGGSTGTAISEIDFYASGTTSLTAGGSFNFNTAGVTVSTGSIGQGATSTIQVTAPSGSITLTVGSSIGTFFSNLINYTGNCNLILNTVNLNSPGLGLNVINKSSSGTITITGNFVPVTGGQNGFTLSSINGNTVVIGNVSGGAGITQHAINQTAGNITVTGNVTGGASGFGINLTGPASQFTINGDVRGGSGTSVHGINFGGTLGTVNGNVTGGSGSGAFGVNATVGGVNVTGNVLGNNGLGVAIAANSSVIGNVFAGGQAGISAYNGSLTLNITGDVYASTTVNGITLLGTGTQVVNLTGKMYNNLGRMAIWCPNIFISNSATTLWRMDIGGGLTRTLYSVDSFPNLPSTSDVRRLVSYGPASGLTGTMWVASPSDIRKGVLTDNTVGTADITATDILNFINTSSDPLAVRMRTMLTDNSAGQLISEYNFV